MTAEVDPSVDARGRTPRDRTSSILSARSGDPVRQYVPYRYIVRLATHGRVALANVALEREFGASAVTEKRKL
ncbi:hypothetical protein WMF45_12050 [Sorangium sp. So ce448]|uniref:hypothetical protein n=1 Tax=Sorangium sp. So ce448 TaxID=3133314 RepID=UPI003F5FA512